MRKPFVFVLAALIISISIMGQNEPSASKSDYFYKLLKEYGFNQLIWNDTVIEYKTRSMYVKLYKKQPRYAEAYQASIPITLKDYNGDIKSIEIVLDLFAPLDSSMKARLCRIYKGIGPSCNGWFVIDSAAFKRRDKSSGSGYLEIAFHSDTTGQPKKRIEIIEGEFGRSRGLAIFHFKLNDGTDFFGSLMVGSYCTTPCEKPPFRPETIRNIALFFLFVSLISRIFIPK